MSCQNLNQRRITAGLLNTLQTEAMAQNLRKNYREKQGYNCGYYAQLRGGFSAYFSSLDHYFDNRRGHHSWIFCGPAHRLLSVQGHPTSAPISTAIDCGLVDWNEGRASSAVTSSVRLG
jgi:hypothetical protein